MEGFREVTVAADDGAVLHGYVHDGETLPVLLLHDLGYDANYWTPFLAAALRRQPRLAVAALDLRAHGGSEIGTETSRKRFVKDLRKWVQQLGIDPPIVVGHGYGADIALSADFIDSVIAVNPALGRPPAPIDVELGVPANIRTADPEAVRMCTVGSANAKPIRRGHREPPLLLMCSIPADEGPEAFAQLQEVAVDTQRWSSATRHLPLESPAGLATLVLGWIEEVA